MKKTLSLLFLNIAFLATTAIPVYAQIQCTIARPGVECLETNGTIRPGTPLEGNDDTVDLGGDEDNGGSGGNDDVVGISNPIGPDDIQQLLAVILSAIVQISIPFLVLAIMWVGFLFVAARGNPEKLGQAKQALGYTLLGALIILGAQTLSVVLSGTIRQLTE